MAQPGGVGNWREKTEPKPSNPKFCALLHGTVALGNPTEEHMLCVQDYFLCQMPGNLGYILRCIIK